MADKDQHDIVEEQNKRQRELIELMRKKQEFEADPEGFVPEGGDTAAVPQTRRSKIANFWYYGKFTIAFILIIAIILAIGVSQCAGRTKYDCTIVLYFKHYCGSAMIDNVSKIASMYCPDTNGDGKVNVLVMDCSIPEEERMLDTGVAKSTRLGAQFTNKEAIIYIVDKEALLSLDEIANGVFVDDSLKLPEYDGKAYKLNGSVFDNAFNSVYENYTDNFEYYVIRRCVDGTAIENKKGVGKFSKLADEIIGKITEDPNPDCELPALSNGLGQ